MQQSAQRVLATDTDVIRDSEAIEKELSDRYFSCTGEEVAKLLPLKAKGVAAARPPQDHGGAIDILQLVDGRTRSFLLNPRACVVPHTGQWLPKLQAKVHFQEGQRMAVASLLVKRRICDWIPLSSFPTAVNMLLIFSQF